MSNQMVDPDDEITQPVPLETMAQIAADWEATFATMATHQRPTRNMRLPTEPPK